MPEGHTVHRLARTLRELFGSERLRVTSPQERFADGAAVLDGRRLAVVEAWGKQLFCGFVPDHPGGPDASATPGASAGPAAPGGSSASAPGRNGSSDPPGSERPDILWLRTHLGLYGAWTFAGAPGVAEVAHAIGAPRKRIGERETVVATVARPTGELVTTGSAASGDALVEGPGVPAERWAPPAPRGQVRARLLGRHAVADLTGPAACEVITSAEKDAVTARLGPDPIRDGEPGHDAEPFVAKSGRSRVTIGQLLMDQAVIAGVGNIYRAEALFRAGVDPLRPGRDVAPSSARAIWEDLVVLMRDGARTGAIVTTRPGDRADGPTSDGRPGAPGVASDPAGRPPSDLVNDGAARLSVTVRPSPGMTDGVAAQPPVRRQTRQNTDGNPDAVPADQAFYVYHRDGLPCRICGSPVLLKELAGRNLFWCGTCQV